MTLLALIFKRIAMRIGLKLLTSKRFWALTIGGIVIFYSLSSIMLFLLLWQLTGKSEAVAQSIEENKNKIVELYSTQLNEEDNGEDDYISTLTEEELVVNPMPEVPTGNTGANNPNTGSGGYNNTSSAADRIEGSSLLHQVYNAIVDNVSRNSADMPWYSFEVVYGANITETSGGDVKWVPYFALNYRDFNASTYNINTWGIDEAFAAKSRGTLNSISSYTQKYVGPFQIAYNEYFTNDIKPTSSWQKSNWQRFNDKVTGGNGYDGNGDGRFDAFNYPDMLAAKAGAVRAKSHIYSGAVLRSDEGRNEIMGMMAATRHVGTTNKDRNRPGGCSFGGKVEWNLWCYPYDENINPHIQLMRSVYEEWKNNGPIYQEYKAFLEGQTLTSSNGTTSATIIRKLYQREGWTYSNGYMTKPFSDGRGIVKIQGTGGQDIYYFARVFWGGKIGKENIQRLLSGSQ